MSKQYQTSDAEASMLGLIIPEEVSVALAEIAESAKEGLLALAVGAGLQVLGTLMEESVDSTGRRNTSTVRSCDAATEPATVGSGGSACDAVAWSAAGGAA